MCSLSLDPQMAIWSLFYPEHQLGSLLSFQMLLVWDLQILLLGPRREDTSSKIKTVLAFCFYLTTQVNQTPEIVYIGHLCVKASMCGQQCEARHGSDSKYETTLVLLVLILMEWSARLWSWVLQWAWTTHDKNGPETNSKQQWEVDPTNDHCVTVIRSVTDVDHRQCSVVKMHAALTKCFWLTFLFAVEKAFHQNVKNPQLATGEKS